MNAFQVLNVLNNVAQFASDDVAYRSALSTLYYGMKDAIMALEDEADDLREDLRGAHNTVQRHYATTLDEVRANSYLRRWVLDARSKDPNSTSIKIPAIKRLRDLTGCGVREGKEFVEKELGL